MASFSIMWEKISLSCLGGGCTGYGAGIQGDLVSLTLVHPASSANLWLWEENYHLDSMPALPWPQSAFTERDW